VAFQSSRDLCEAGGYDLPVPDQPSKRPRGRPPLPREDQRRRLFDAAIRAFEKFGYEVTRIADIVQEAGMSSRSFYELFASKEDLVAEYVERAAEGLVKRLVEVWATAEDPLERIDRGVQTFLEILPAIRVDLDALGGEAGRRTRDARKNAVREISRLMLADLNLAHREGRLESPPDPVAVELVMTGVEALSLRYFGEGRKTELAQLRPSLVQLLTRAGMSPTSLPTS
jgi:AcrR family transcriptional regulator